MLPHKPEPNILEVSRVQCLFKDSSNYTTVSTAAPGKRAWGDNAREAPHWTTTLDRSTAPADKFHTEAIGLSLNREVCSLGVE